MNTKNRIKILLTLAVVLSISATAMAMTVPAKPLGLETNPYLKAWSGGPIEIDLHITDAVTDVNDLTFRWETNYDADPNYIMTFTQVNPADPNVWEVSMTKPAPTNRTNRTDFYCHVTDDNGEVKSDRIRVYIFDNACKMTMSQYPDTAIIPTDLNSDCTTNLKDFAIMADVWLGDYTPTDPIPIGL